MFQFCNKFALLRFVFALLSWFRSFFFHLLKNRFFELVTRLRSKNNRKLHPDVKNKTVNKQTKTETLIGLNDCLRLWKSQWFYPNLYFKWQPVLKNKWLRWFWNIKPIIFSPQFNSILSKHTIESFPWIKKHEHKFLNKHT